MQPDLVSAVGGKCEPFNRAAGQFDRRIQQEPAVIGCSHPHWHVAWANPDLQVAPWNSRAAPAILLGHGRSSPILAFAVNPCRAIDSMASIPADGMRRSGESA